MSEDKTREAEAQPVSEAPTLAEPLAEPEQAVEEELFPSSDAAAAPVGLAAQKDAAPSVEDGSEDEEDEASTFASPEAPWVGAEQKWLNGDVPTAGQAAQQGDGAQAAGRQSSVLLEDDDFLLRHPLPMLASIPPPPPPMGVSLGVKLGILAAVLVVVGAAAAVVFWMGERFSAREREILALRASEEQHIIRLERQIGDLLAKGGAENQERANELQVALQVARKEAATLAAASTAEVGTAAVDQVADTAAEDGTDARDRERHRRHRRGSGEEEEAAPTTADPTSTVPPVASPPAPPQAPTASDDNPYPEDPGNADLLNNAIREPRAMAAAAAGTGGGSLPGGDATLPLSPTREQVKSAMDAVAPLVKRCGQGGGRIVLTLAVAGPTGRVLSAEPTGTDVGTPLGICAARAVKLAKFPRFQQSRMLIKYPFDL